MWGFESRLSHYATRPTNFGSGRLALRNPGICERRPQLRYHPHRLRVTRRGDASKPPSSVILLLSLLLLSVLPSDLGDYGELRKITNTGHLFSLVRYLNEVGPIFGCEGEGQNLFPARLRAI